MGAPRSLPNLHSAEAPPDPVDPGAIPCTPGIKHGIDPRADPGEIIIAFIPGSIPEAIPQLVQDQSQGAGSWDQSWDERAGSPILHPSTPHVTLNHTLLVCPQPLPPTPNPRQSAAPAALIIVALFPLLALAQRLTARFPQTCSRCGDEQGVKVSAEHRTRKT